MLTCQQTFLGDPGVHEMGIPSRNGDPQQHIWKALPHPRQEPLVHDSEGRCPQEPPIHDPDGRRPQEHLPMLGSDHLEGAALALCWLRNSAAWLPETPPLGKMIPLAPEAQR